MAQKKQSPIDEIRRYLDERAKTDTLFAASYAKENKSINECWTYIVSEARKRASGNCCCMTSEEVFSLAVHYYDEDEIKITPVKKAKAAVAAMQNKQQKTASPDKKTSKRQEQAKSKPAKKIIQLELFNFDEL